MTTWNLPKTLVLSAAAPQRTRCFAYACAEMSRLLGRLGIDPQPGDAATADHYRLQLGDGTFGGVVTTIRHDGYELQVKEGGACLCAPSAKGLLNAVYDLAERLGFRFLMPGEGGEWPPESGRSPSLPIGIWRREPRFSHRGVFGGINVPPYSREEWLRFFAKLRFNAQSSNEEDAALAEELGIRLEIGGHGMASLLPRELFAERPELFRMFQPEDFGGKRQPDANFCPTHPETAKLVSQGFQRQVESLRGVYAVHAWADDLPAGGWCMCSRCRSFTPSDQSMLAMNLQADVVADTQPGMRVPAIAYHDTLFPGCQIPPAPQCFLLYAPRERCYAHALDDPACPKNRWHLQALHEWMACFKDHTDAHTFEYYFDQILYRGLYFFLPDVIIRDMAVYEQAGIASHMSLQVGGALLAPDYNMLVFARAHWDSELTTEAAITQLAEQLSPQQPAPWQRYLSARSQACAAACSVCEVPNAIYFDYRFMPEITGPFGDVMVTRQADSARALQQAAATLSDAAPAIPPHQRNLMLQEVNRARFEAEDLLAMSRHQAGLNGISRYLASRDPALLPPALEHLRQALQQLEKAAAMAREIGMPESAYYHAFNRDWTAPEIRAKLQVYETAVAT